MIPKDMASYIRKKTHTNSTTFPDADMLLYLGTRMDELASEVVDYDEDYFGAPQTTDLVNNQREYPFPTDMVNHIKAVEAKLDTLNWLRLRPLDLTQYPFTTDEATIVSYFGNTQDNAFFFIYRGSLWLLSGTLSGFVAGNAALKLWSYQWPSHITDLTSTVDLSVDPNNISAGFPRSLHLVLCDAVVIDYKQSADKPIQLNDYDLAWEKRKDRALMTLTEMNKDGANSVTMPRGNRVWDNGFNL